MSERSLVSTLNYLPALDGLRGMAVLLVVLFHCFTLPFGWVGVNLFFVLSGFLITRILLERQAQADYFTRFYRNRVLRIFPLYFTVIVFYFIIQYLLYGANMPHSPLYFLFFLQNFLYAKTGFTHTTALQHTWSLAIEEQFYLFFPLIVYFFKKNLGFFIGITLFLVLIIRFFYAFHADWCTAYIATQCRIDGLLIGAGLAYFKIENRPNKQILAYISGLLLFIIVVLSIFFKGKGLVSNGISYTLIDLAAAYLVFECTKKPSSNEPNTPFQRLFNNSFLRFLGKYSYGLYVYHWLVYSTFRLHLRPFFPPVLWAKVSVSLLAVALSMLLALLSYHFLEKPFLNLKK
jgi:peptidoglycan/LPS O-acetylase OafA/YrhL